MINKSRAARRQRLDTMKKKNKNYLSLTEQGIKKAWDKVVIFKGYTEKLQMVVYYANKPFYYWPVKRGFDIDDLKLSLSSMLYLYNTATLNERKVKKQITRYFVSEAGERVVTYRRGDLFQPTEVV